MCEYKIIYRHNQKKFSPQFIIVMSLMFKDKGFQKQQKKGDFFELIAHFSAESIKSSGRNRNMYSKSERKQLPTENTTPEG